MESGLSKHASTRVRVRSRVRPYDGTVGDVADLGRRLGAALGRRGVGAGDVVAFQLPNWAETAACFYGLLSLGCVIVPIVHVYGAKELGHILEQSGAKVLITADRFGSQDFLENLESVREPLAGLELVVVIDVDRPGRALPRSKVPWSALVRDADPVESVATVEPDDPVVVGYTSGTTSDPKGVVHTHRTLLAEMRQLTGFRHGDPLARAVDERGMISGAPMSHIVGLVGVLRPALGIGPLDVIDQWDPAVVLQAMVEDQVSAGSGVTYFLTSLLDHPDFDAAVHLPLMPSVGLGGAPVPPEVARRVADLGITLNRAYGSTEHPSTTLSLPGDPERERLYTDGRPMDGVELRLVDDSGRAVPEGTPGEILSRGPDLFAGYTDPDLTAAAIDSEGWYATGDIGVLDRGYLTITDRKKDIIIRGGENVSAAEVEGLLQRMPGVAEVAVVAAPDARYGEHVAAMVRLTAGASEFGLDTVRVHLRRGGLARQKWPEELHFVEDLPRTASGKVQKHLLRARLTAPSDDPLRGS
jgi:acyl-CoA synthetase (AMP-forming)/AMP-acid ligase II